MNGNRQLNPTHRALDALLSRQGRDLPLAKRLGMHHEAALALRWFRRRSVADSAAPRPEFVLGFADDCPARRLPAFLRSPVDGETLPIRALRGAGYGRAHTWVRAKNESHPLLTGTLGGVLRSLQNPSKLFAVTAGHVLGAQTGSVQGDEVGFSFERERTANFGGKLFDWSPNFTRTGEGTPIDAALAIVTAEAVGNLAERQDEWPTGATGMVSFEELLCLRTRGDKIFGQSAQRISSQMRVADNDALIYTINNALCWKTLEPTQGGDSGAPIWNQNDELVALHAGSAPEGSELNAVAVPIGEILTWAGAEIVRRGEPLLRAPILRSSGLLLPTVGPAPVASQAPAGNQVQRAAASAAPGSDVDVLARTMWGEARGEPDAAAGMGAVAHVLLNRVLRQTWWGKTVVQVCRKPFQFSCWNPNDPNFPKLQSVDSSNAVFALALDIASSVLARPREDWGRDDPTNGATHYHTRNLNPPPRWSGGHFPCARIGGHVFYNDIA